MMTVRFQNTGDTPFRFWPPDAPSYPVNPGDTIEVTAPGAEVTLFIVPRDDVPTEDRE